MKKILFLCFLAYAVNSQSFTKFKSKEIQGLSYDSLYQNINWEPIINQLKGKQIVALGEFNHGNKEVFSSRTSLIKILHKKLGFNLILFESGLGEMFVINEKMKYLKDKQLTSGFFWGWRTSEFIELMNYVKENRISVGGFDVQRTGNGFADYVISKYNNLEIKSLEQKFVQLKKKLSSYRTTYLSIKNDVISLTDGYRNLYNVIDDQYIKKGIENRISYLNYMSKFSKTKNFHERWKARDMAMAENVKWLINTYPKEQKAILVGHNFHISRYSKNEETMGEILSKEYGEQMYVLGVYAGKGSYLDNSGTVKHLHLPDKNTLDLKHIIASQKATLSYIHFSKKVITDLEWVSSPILINDTFIDLQNSNSLILNKSFDGVLLYKHVSASNHIN